MKTNEVLENIKARRSVRAYTEQQVPEEDLRTILEAATYAPSGMHLETWHFTAIQNVSKLAELNERIKGAFAKSDDVRLQERARNKAYCCYYHAPTLVIVSNEPTQWWAGMDCACAIENMFLAAQSLGIGSCWINQLGTTCDDPGVREFITALGVPVSHKVYGCVALGYGDPKIQAHASRNVSPGLTQRYHSEWVATYGLPMCCLHVLHLPRIYYRVHSLSDKLPSHVCRNVPNGHSQPRIPDAAR